MKGEGWMVKDGGQRMEGKGWRVQDGGDGLRLKVEV